jgi:hypothetical protein
MNRKPLWLSEDDARRVLLVRSIETEDSDSVVLTRDDRQYATSAALSAAPLREQSDRRETGAFLAKRAGLALDRLMARDPAALCSASSNASSAPPPRASPPSRRSSAGFRRSPATGPPSPPR